MNNQSILTDTDRARALELFEQSQAIHAPGTLEECERDIQVAQDLQQFSYYVQGVRLRQIRDGRLYKAVYSNFPDYCRERWGMTEARASQLIGASNVVDNIRVEPLTIVKGDAIPQTESQARPLSKLSPEEQPIAWQTAVETAPNGKVTAKHVAEVVERMQRPEPETPATVSVTRTVSGVPVDSINDNGKMAVHFSSETPEHYTPDDILDLVVAVMGGIDLDPCSNSKEHPNVPALNHYTESDDGLSLPWNGRVFMNPPYGREIPRWVDKLVGEYRHGGVDEAIALVPARTDTQWWACFMDYPFCLVVGRITFIGNNDPAPFPSALIYLGENVDKFYHEFSPVGHVCQRLESFMFGEGI